MMTEEQFYFLKLMEECSELAHRCSKIMQFGPDDMEPGSNMTNIERLQAERLDVLSVGKIMEEKGLLDLIFEDKFREAVELKRRKIEHFLELSRRLGRVK